MLLYYCKKLKLKGEYMSSHNKVFDALKNGLLSIDPVFFLREQPNFGWRSFSSAWKWL